MEIKSILVQMISTVLSIVLLALLARAVFYYLNPVPGTLAYALITLTVTLLGLILLFRLVSFTLLLLGIGPAFQNVLFLILLIVGVAWFVSPTFKKVITDIFG